MPVFFLNLESLRYGASQMQAARGEIDALAAQLQNKVQAVVGQAWISPSATQMAQEYMALHRRLLASLDDMERLQRRLERHIQLWEALDQI